MPHIKYRASTTPTVPTESTVKGSPLTNLEVDGNIKSLANALDSRLTIDNPSIYGDVTLADPLLDITNNVYPEIKPSLHLRFDSDNLFDSRISFTRSS